MSPVDYSPGRKVDAQGNTQFNPGTITPLQTRKVWWNWVDSQIYIGSIVQYTAAADPRDGYDVNGGPGYQVEKVAAFTGVGKAKIAGIVVDLGQTSGAEDGFITIAALIPGQVYTFAVAVGIDTGDGLQLANDGQYCDDGGAYAVTDIALCLYDEDDTNNPHGVNAITAAIGLVEAIYTGYDLQNTA